MSELSILIPDETINLREETLIIRPCRVSQLKTILGVVNKYVEKITETEDAIALAGFILQDSGEKALADIYSVLESCCSHAKLTINQEFLENLYYDELVLLIAKFVELNKDFFSRIGKLISRAVEEQKIGESKSAD